MQEEVDQKTIALAVKTGKLTAQVLQAAIRKYLAARQKGTGKAHHGQQSQDDNDCGEKWGHNSYRFFPVQRSETDVTKLLRRSCGAVKLPETAVKGLKSGHGR